MLIEIIEYKNGKLNWEEKGKFDTGYLCDNDIDFEPIEENIINFDKVKNFNQLLEVVKQLEQRVKKLEK